LAETLSSRVISKIYASPILRARQTAETVSQRLGLDVEFSDALREYDCGELEGKRDEQTWADHYKILTAWLHDQNFHACTPRGERFYDIERRFVPFIDKLRETHTDDETILLLGHGGVYRAMLPILCENISFEFVQTTPMPNTVIIETFWTPTGLVCLNWDGNSV
jgi:broad specificity phosphatase PhoE